MDIASPRPGTRGAALFAGIGCSSLVERRPAVVMDRGTAPSRTTARCATCLRPRRAPQARPRPPRSTLIGEPPRRPTARARTRAARSMAAPSARSPSEHTQQRQRSRPGSTPTLHIGLRSARENPTHASSERHKTPHTFAPTDAFTVVCSCMKLLRAAGKHRVAAVLLDGAA
jgi:hypothetical protein